MHRIASIVRAVFQEGSDGLVRDYRIDQRTVRSDPNNCHRMRKFCRPEVAVEDVMFLPPKNSNTIFPARLYDRIVSSLGGRRDQQFVDFLTASEPAN